MRADAEPRLLVLNGGGMSGGAKKSVSSTACGDHGRDHRAALERRNPDARVPDLAVREVHIGRPTGADCAAPSAFWPCPNPPNKQRLV
jgi:hypothetical protein